MSGAFVYVTALGLCAGMALALLWPLGLVAAGVALCGSALLLVMAAARPAPIVLLGAALCAALALGVVRSDAALAGEAAQTVPHYIGQRTSVAGRVAADPDRRATSQRVTLAVGEVNDTPAQGTLQVALPLSATLAYGDDVVVEGSITAPQPFDTDTGRTFNYPGYLRVQGIRALMPAARLASTTPGGQSLPRALFALKHTFETSLGYLLPQPDLALMEGLILGERGGIPPALNDAFIKSGLVHIVALSGYNVSIVAEAVFRALAFLPELATLSLGALAMILFTLLVGAGSTTLRALLMALIALLARYLNRPHAALRALALAASAMALWNPLVLLYDTSFILSVLATFGLITLAPWVEQHLAHLRLFRHKRLLSTRSIVATTIGVELFVLPALLYFSGVLSLVSIPANALVLPVVPAAMLAGFISGLLGLVSPVLGFVPALAADALLKWMLGIVSLASAVPFGALVAPAFPAWLLAILYVPLTLFALYQHTAHRLDIPN